MYYMYHMLMLLSFKMNPATKESAVNSFTHFSIGEIYTKAFKVIVALHKHKKSQWPQVNNIVI